MKKMRFLRKRRSGLVKHASPDPMGSVANLVDCMLVFACGLMIVVVAFKQVDLDTLKEIRKDDTQGYEQMGTTYYDEKNDTYYVVKPADDASQ